MSSEAKPSLTLLERDQLHCPAALVFTDSSPLGWSALITDGYKEPFPTQETSTKWVEVIAIINLFKGLEDNHFNL